MTLFLAMLLDAALGEPRWLWGRVPHPAVLMGRALGWCDARFNRGDRRATKGAAVILALVAGAWIIGAVLDALPLVPLLLAAILLAQRSLVDHVRDVARALERSVAEGRRAVGRIVGRDTSAMDRAAVARAAIESSAENFSDGVVAPAFWFLIAGVPGLLIYKLVNTADSMIGYRTERHAAFGGATARLDDLLNWIPARLTAALILAVHGWPARWGDVAADAGKHRSPNAGWPETAMARVLDVALAGPRSYDGRMHDLAFVHEGGARDIGAAEVAVASRVLWRSWAGLLALAGVIALF